jgi:phosphonopyruvate decarboxylase
MNASEFCSLLKAHGFNFAAGVPCSILKDIITHLMTHSEISYVPATREDEAMGIATGAYLAGKKPVVLMQNSGLGNAVNPLTSLGLLYKISVLLVISWRGYQGKDAPEHLIMGRVITKLLEDLGVPFQIMSKEDPQAAVITSVKSMEEQKIPVAILLRDGIIK